LLTRIFLKVLESLLMRMAKQKSPRKPRGLRPKRKLSSPTARLRRSLRERPLQRSAPCFQLVALFFINHGIYLQKKTAKDEAEDDEGAEEEEEEEKPKKKRAPAKKAEPKEKAAPKKRAPKKKKAVGVFFLVFDPLCNINPFFYLGI
jgi:cytoskeletal protein RodZ